MDKLIAKGMELINNGQKVLVFSGAGLSTESGIPDFRSPGGIWEKYDPGDFEFQKLMSDERAREKYWKMSVEYYGVMKAALPNRAHLALKELEDLGKLLVIVTQNIDNLHHKAGHSREKIIEIHGTAFAVACLKCGKQYDREEIERRIRSGIKVPYCDDCKGFLKPTTISFGQALPQDKMAAAFKYASQCDLCLVLGSSLVVYPAASVPEQAVEQGAKLLIINRDKTHLDRRADLVIHDSVAKVLGEIMEGVSGKKER
jgi:NAD-dependent deacetylase